MVKEVHLVDTAFAHAPGMSWYNVPKLMKWVRGENKRVPVRFFTDRFIGYVDQYPADTNVALLIEPVGIGNNGYQLCLDKLAQFKYVLTYNHNFKQQVGDKGLFYPIGGCWLKQDQLGIHPKTKNCSIIASEKRETTGHCLRHEVIEKFGGKLDVYGRGYRPVESKFEALAPYHYSVVIENCIEDDLFTEKLIDCMLCGTIPIYWGTKNIGNYFDAEAIIQVDSAEEIGQVLQGAGSVIYGMVEQEVRANFNRAMQYRVAEDWIFEKFPFLLT